MAETECPWCAGPAALVIDGRAGARDAVDCADCGVRVELAPDPAVSELGRAA